LWRLLLRGKIQLNKEAAHGLVWPKGRRMRKRQMSLDISPEQLKAGCLAFKKGERRDAIYNTASFLVEHFWGNPAKVADGLGVLLLVWNQAFYRQGSFDFGALEARIAQNQKLLADYRKRDVLTYSPNDNAKIKQLFRRFLEALEICEKGNKGRRTPVGVAKALHLLAPGFFPLWDAEIAKRYACHYAVDPEESYLVFIKKTKDIAEKLSPSVRVSGRTLVKMIDEYNYAKYTKRWIK
jgi:hypothetical protein